MLVSNEQELLPRLINYVKPFVSDMIIVVDDASNDKTESIARTFTSKVLRTQLGFDFSAARNKGLEPVGTPWVFWLDADEWPTRELLLYIQNYIRSPGSMRKAGLIITRETLIDGKPIGDLTYGKSIRVFRSGFQFVGRIHEGIAINPQFCIEVPENLLLLHHKTKERQERANQFYMNWPEQRAIIAHSE
jgi:glycosyltransferase involved in cell wall biosynthesis